MNYRKVDATLVAALAEIENAEEPRLSVFIHMKEAPSASATTFLETLGVKVNSTRQHIFTATVSPRKVEELSQQPWVRYVKLSQKLRLLHGK